MMARVEDIDVHVKLDRSKIERERRFPVMEVFGPTVQGEGPDAGRPCLFVRFGGCDYRCSWCDSLHAVIPAQVRAGAEKMTAADIVSELRNLVDPEPGVHMQRLTVVLSGGNPVLHDLGPLVDELHAHGFRAVVETQGSKWKDWLVKASLVVCSPKPPSSGMETDWNALETFVNGGPPGTGYRGQGWESHGQLAFKVVVGDERDYQFARTVHERFPAVPFYLSVLNPEGSGEAFYLDDVLATYRWLCERIADDPIMRNARAFPQLHTLAWANEKGR